VISSLFCGCSARFACEAVLTNRIITLVDEAKPMEPWFYDLEPPFPLDDDSQDKIDALNLAGRAIVTRMVEHIAVDENVPAEAITPQFADLAIDRARDAINAARNAGPAGRPTTDIEELAFRYMDAMRLWLRIYRAARDANTD
jgi:hypothetical protein